MQVSVCGVTGYGVVKDSAYWPNKNKAEQVKA
jgi:hypothetical protein